MAEHEYGKIITIRPALLGGGSSHRFRAELVDGDGVVCQYGRTKAEAVGAVLLIHDGAPLCDMGYGGYHIRDLTREDEEDDRPRTFNPQSLENAQKEVNRAMAEKVDRLTERKLRIPPRCAPDYEILQTTQGVWWQGKHRIETERTLCALEAFAEAMQLAFEAQQSIFIDTKLRLLADSLLKKYTLYPLPVPTQEPCPTTTASSLTEARRLMALALEQIICAEKEGRHE